MDHWRSISIEHFKRVAEIQALRRKAQEFEQQHEEAEKAHSDAESTMNVSINNLQAEVDNLRAKVEKDIKEKERLKKFVTKMKSTEERIKRDSEDPSISDPAKRIKEELNSVIQSEEAKIRGLKLEREQLKETVAVKEKQTQMWNDILSVFKCKIKCAEESRQSSGIVVRRGGAETLVLQE